MSKFPLWMALMIVAIPFAYHWFKDKYFPAKLARRLTRPLGILHAWWEKRSTLHLRNSSNFSARDVGSDAKWIRRKQIFDEYQDSVQPRSEQETKDAIR